MIVVFLQLAGNHRTIPSHNYCGNEYELAWLEREAVHQNLILRAGVPLNRLYL